MLHSRQVLPKETGCSMFIRVRGVVFSIFSTLLLVTACSSPQDENTDVNDIVVREPGTIDEQLLAIDEYAPGFGGMFYDDSMMLNVHFIGADTASQATRARLTDALKAVFGFGEDVTTDTIKFIPGTYRWADLYTWYGKITRQISSPHIVFFDMDEAINRLAIGVDDLSVVPELVARLEGLGVPEEAVDFMEDEFPTVGTDDAPSTTFDPQPRP